MGYKKSGAGEPSGREPDFPLVIGLVLKWGVTISSTLIAAGSILMFVDGQTGYPASGLVGQLTSKYSGLPLGVASVIQGASALKPFAIIDMGLLVLLATPILRVAISIPLFTIEKRVSFVVITSVVLTILMLSVLVVAPLVSS